VKFHEKILLLWLLLALVSPLYAGSFFEDDSPLEIELTGPLWSLIENKNERKEWPFRLSLGTNELDLLLRARGHSRMRVCDFPPLRFNFGNTDTTGTVFEGQDKLKLVTRCRKNDRSEDDALEEYAAYRIFGLLSDVSFRVRLVHITYKDTDDHIKEKYRTSYGFLIEPQEQLASRVGGSLSEIPAVSLKRLDKHQAALVYIYQYLIGNTDWSLVAADGDENCCHNVKLIKIGSKQFPVPFDFDLAGVVNAGYAHPDPSLKIDKVWKRLYRGFCTEPDVLKTALTTITSRQDKVMDVIAGLPALTEKEKAKQIDYLEGFFRKAADKDKIIKSFEKNCHP
jgi:hypothetical protein